MANTCLKKGRIMYNSTEINTVIKYLAEETEPIEIKPFLEKILARETINDIDLREAIWDLINRDTIILTWDMTLELNKPLCTLSGDI